MGLDPGLHELANHTQVSQTLCQQEGPNVPLDLVLFAVQKGNEVASIRKMSLGALLPLGREEAQDFPCSFSFRIPAR